MPPDESGLENRFKPVLLEVVTLLSVLYLPGAVYTLLQHPAYPRYDEFGWGTMAYDAIRYSSFILLLLFTIWTSGDRLAAFGIRRPDGIKDTLLATAAFATTVIAYALAALLTGHRPIYWLAHFGRSLEHVAITPVVGLGILSMALVTTINAAFQELLMRGYAVTRFRELFGSTTLAIVVSGILFSLWHVYQGLDGVIASLLMGLAFGWIFAKSGRLWPLVAGHALYNVLIHLSR